MTSAARSEKDLRKTLTFANDARLLLAKMQGGIAPSITCRGPRGLEILQHWHLCEQTVRGKSNDKHTRIAKKKKKKKTRITWNNAGLDLLLFYFIFLFIYLCLRRP